MVSLVVVIEEECVWSSPVEADCMWVSECLRAVSPLLIGLGHANHAVREIPEHSICGDRVSSVTEHLASLLLSLSIDADWGSC